MIYVLAFACAVALGWLASYRLGGTAERETMCLLTCIWTGTLIASMITQSNAPVEFFAPLDFFALGWLFLHQRRNWQWIPAGLFAAMMLVHFMQWGGISAGLLNTTGRPYKDFISFLAYMQIASVGWASYERWRHRNKLDPVMGHWFLAGNWVLHRRRHSRNNARKA